MFTDLDKAIARQAKKVEKPVYEPYSDRIVVRRVDIEFKTAGGIFLGEIEKERETMYAKVIAVGDGKQVDSKGIIPMKSNVGDLLVIRYNVPTKINVRGEELFVLRESDVLLRLNDANAVEKEFKSEGYEFDASGAKILGG